VIFSPTVKLNLVICMFLTLNTQFAIRQGKSCSYLVKVNGIFPENEDTHINDATVTILPPSIGYILNAIGQDEYHKSLELLSGILGVSSKSLNLFLGNLSSDKPHRIVIDSQEVVIPGNILVHSTKPTGKVQFKPSFRSAKLLRERPPYPLTMNLMVTTRCTTNCCYCYAKRNFSYELSIDEIVSIIDECHKIGVVNLSLTGGDIFAMKGWREILLSARENGYNPFLSTKTPLNCNDIEFLKSIGIKELQFSLDTVDSKTLYHMIGVHEVYLSKVETMFRNCEEKGIKISIRTVLCKQNTLLSYISRLHRFINKFDSVREWILTPAFFSEFKEQYKQYEVCNEQLVSINKFVETLGSSIHIAFNKVSSNGYQLKRHNNVEDFVCHNQTCNANTYSMSILPSGECTICEMLYENEEYLLGNVRTDNILNIWNSKKAFRLYSPLQSDMSENSPCHNCSVFNQCKRGINKRVCYVDIAKVNKDRYSISMPNPRCPMSQNIDLIL